MSELLVQLQDATIKQHCKTVRMPIMGSQFSRLAEKAVHENRTHVGSLEALLTGKIEEREKHTIERRLKEARLPRVKTLDEFDFDQSPLVMAAKMRELADGGYVEKAEPVLLIGIVAPARLIFSPDCAWLPADRNGEFYRFRRTLERQKKGAKPNTKKWRRGNDGPWKAWEAKPGFPPFPPSLETRKTGGFPHFHGTTTIPPIR